MSKYYVGKNVSKLDKSPALDPYSKVVIIVGEDDETGEQVIYEAGNDTGRVLEINNQWGTQQMANDILSRISGYAYRPFSAVDASVPDEADIGDTITSNGVYAPIIRQELTFDSIGSSNISAPSGDETENEFGLVTRNSAINREMTRKINRMTTRFIVERGRIEAEIDDMESDINTQFSIVNGQIATKITSGQAQTLISQNLNTISLSASAGTNKSTITISANGVVVDSVVAKFSNIVADSIVANSSITSPSVIGGRFWDASQKASLYIAYSGGYGRLMYGAGSITSQSDALFGIDADYVATRAALYLAGHEVLSSSFTDNTLTVDPPLRLYDKLNLSSSSYGSSKPADSQGVRGQVFFLLE